MLSIWLALVQLKEKTVFADRCPSPDVVCRHIIATISIKRLVQCCCFYSHKKRLVQSQIHFIWGKMACSLRQLVEILVAMENEISRRFMTERCF